MELIEFYINKYKSLIDLEILMREHILYIDNLSLLQLIESNFSMSINIYDFIMNYNSILKYDEESLIQYIQSKYPHRYKYTLHHICYDKNKQQFYKIYQFQIEFIQNKIYQPLLEDCIICFDTKPTMLKTNCSHIYCQDCFESYYHQHNKSECAYCRQTIFHYDQYLSI